MMSLADSGESHAGNPGPSLEGVRAAMARGEYLMAYDEVMAALELRPDDLALQYQAVLALARAGAIDRAGELVRTFGFDRPHATALAPDLAEDLAALAARLAKDRALASVGAERTARARQAAESYEAIYRRMGRPYTCINAATMWLVAGEGDRAKELAFVASDLCARATPSSREDEYWLAATQAEASRWGMSVSRHRSCNRQVFFKRQRRRVLRIFLSVGRPSQAVESSRGGEASHVSKAFSSESRTWIRDRGRVALTTRAKQKAPVLFQSEPRL